MGRSRHTIALPARPPLACSATLQAPPLTQLPHLTARTPLPPRLALHRGDYFLNYTYFVSRSGGSPGIAEMLEVLGSIASGFAVPIKEEHRTFLIRCLLPLHSVQCTNGFEFFHEQLGFVLLQYATKDPELTVTMIGSLLKYWPNTSATKQARAAPGRAAPPLTALEAFHACFCC